MLWKRLFTLALPPKLHLRTASLSAALSTVPQTSSGPTSSDQGQLQDQTRLLSNVSRQVLKTSKYGDTTTFLGNTYQWLTVLLLKHFSLICSWMQELGWLSRNLPLCNS